jgi:predicted nucleic acid-binding protein
MTQTTAAELQNLVVRGSVKMPRFASDLPVISDVTDVNARVNIRGMIAAMKPNSPSLFGDGSIGATALNTGLPVITADRNFAAALQELGVEVRVP